MNNEPTPNPPSARARRILQRFGLLLVSGLCLCLIGSSFLFVDETDIVIQGTDITGSPVWWNQSSALDFVNDMESDPDIDAVPIGIKMSVSIKVPDRKTVEPHAHWLAMDKKLQDSKIVTKMLYK